MNETEKLEDLKIETERLQEEVRKDRILLANNYLKLANNFVRLAGAYYSLGDYNEAKRSYNGALRAYRDSVKFVKNPPTDTQSLDQQFAKLRHALANIPKKRKTMNSERGNDDTPS